MTDRPSGSSSAPPRRPRYEVGKPDALSVVLGVDNETATNEPFTTVEVSILRVLSQSKEPLSVAEVARKTQQDFLPLSRGLVDLRGRGAITLEGSPGNEIVSLRETL
jgi:hypothetical protein